MKACLMKVNYNPKYTTPHQTRAVDRYQTTKEIYGAPLVDGRFRERVNLHQNGDKTKRTDGGEGNLRPLRDKNSQQDSTERHKQGVAKAHAAIKLHPIHSKEQPQKHATSYSEKFKRQTSFQIFDAKKPLVYAPPRTTDGQKGRRHQEATYSIHYSRSKTVAGDPHFLGGRSFMKSQDIIEMERKAKVFAERAIKNKKIFTILGPYPSLRHALRRRGWVEKFENAPLPSLTSFNSPRRKDSLTDDGMGALDKNGNPVCRPWEEDNGYYGMMSHVVRNVSPQLLFTVKANVAESRALRGTQVFNHFGKAHTFTTKVGLCTNIKNAPWYGSMDPESFFPRCYRLDDEEEKEAFIEDYHRTACFGIVKHFVHKYKDRSKEKTIEEAKKENISEPQQNAKDNNIIATGEPGDGKADNSEKTEPQDSTKVDGGDGSNGQAAEARDSAKRDSISTIGSARDETETNGKQSFMADGETRITINVSPVMSPGKQTRRGRQLSIKVLETAVQQCERFLRLKEHDDIDSMSDCGAIPAASWEQILVWHDQFIRENGDISPYTESMVAACEGLLGRIREIWPQYELDGTRNVWILKPGAKSRGRGITCSDNLKSIFKTMKEAGDHHFIVQKYIERPFLVYNIKFDIRQWFMVTDWNPLTMWIYRDCYLRFCSQQYTLNNFNESIHLSNNSVQKHYRNGPRSSRLPEENMWTSDEFDTWLREQGHGEVWKEKVVPGMRDAILATLLCSQEHVDNRKSAFELYGADFMITEEFQPWLLEINTSPSMSRSTKVTAKLVDAVLEDTMKVVLDRRYDKSADTGRFELSYRQQPLPEPPPADSNLTITGKRIRKRIYRK